jgi:two-component system OmpR family response regulator
VGSSQNILVVDDDPRICRVVARYLRSEGYTVHTASDSAEMRHQMVNAPPDLLILDIVLPGENGLSLAKSVRTRSEVPIIMLTGKSNTVDKVVGLEIGADDYITKPFEERELLARVHSVLRRSSQKASQASNRAHSVVYFAGWRLDLIAHELTSPNAATVYLTTHEWDLLYALVERYNRVLSREDLLESVAGREWAPQDRSIDVLVGKLRAKLEDDPQHPKLIRTIRGLGYKFTCKVEFS